MRRKILTFGVFRKAVLFAFIIAAPFLLYSKTFTTTNHGDWNTTNNWTTGGVPNPDGSNIGANDVINIQHNITLDGSFLANKNNLTINVGIPGGEPVELIISNKVEIRNTVYINLFENATLIIGDKKLDLPLPCEGDDDYSVRDWLLDVDGSGSQLDVSPGARFEVIGDMYVNNKFSVKVQQGGDFVVHGKFVAGNSAEVDLLASSAYVGCDMIFDNGAKITMLVATLNVMGDLLFGNSADIILGGSTLNVGGAICSYEGLGGGAVVNITGDPENESIIIGNFCSEITINISNGGVILPIELLAFSLQTSARKIYVTWTTGSEINNDFFTIERSRDLFGWEILGYETGAGNSSTPINYSFSDLTPLDGLAYYRLKQTDFDGKFKYYGPIAAHYDLGMEGLEFKVMKQFSKWVIVVPNDGIYQVELYNLSGQRLISEKVSNTLSVPAPDGAVVIRVTDGLARSVSRVVM